MDNTNKNSPVRPLYSRLSLLWYTLTAAAVVGVDQLTKWLAVTRLKPIGDIPLWQDVLHLTYVENTGAAFGSFKDSRWVFMVASTVAIIAVYVYLCVFARKIKPVIGVALAMILGGGIGNMIDRLLNGFVVDFINFELINFAVFNGADSFICVGAGLMIIYILVFEMRTEKASDNESNQSKA